LLWLVLGSDGVVPSRMLTACTRLCALAFHQLDNETAVAAAVCFFWAAAGLVLLAAWVVSLGSYALQRRRLRRACERGAVVAEDCHNDAAAAVKQFGERAGVPSVRLSVLSSDGVAILSNVFGLFRPSRFVLVSGACFERLDTERLHALFAHEVAHIASGDCRRDVLLRWLGRATFVGDSFVRAIEDSFGQEARADETAVLELGADREALCKAITWAYHVGAADGQSLPGNDSLGAAPGADTRYRQALKALMEGGPGLWQWWRHAFVLFWAQHAAAPQISYWYPDFKERRARIRRLQPRNL
jgi:hypothetical protein